MSSTSLPLGLVFRLLGKKSVFDDRIRKMQKNAISNRRREWEEIYIAEEKEVWKKQKREKRNCKNNGILAQCYKFYKVSCKFHNAINTFEFVYH
jgi:hypothetical protein